MTYQDLFLSLYLATAMHISIHFWPQERFHYLTKFQLNTINIYILQAPCLEIVVDFVASYGNNHFKIFMALVFFLVVSSYIE